ncbi:MAG: Coenzyme F420 hydrogenase/dehydrogenase, beta subunit C-terminal domain [Methanothermobacter sp.]|uniref:Coenzyme F420 hydrogenase/dehydrogenase, beta subunit C-terminal domain n=1 Tax=Methanothermobacter sp. TaxID=1884223 RepID=UPI003C754118
MSRYAMVGTPCQITAATLMKEYNGEFPVELRIGLFCMENFSYTYLKELAEEEGVDLRDVSECRIEKGRLWFHLNDGSTVSIPLERARSAMRKNCSVCMDFTSEQSDVSVGSVGSPQGWSTLIIRTERGRELVEGASKAGYIETEPITGKGLKLLEKLASGKKEENLEEIKRRESVARPVLYWRVMPGDLYPEEIKDYQFDDLRADVIDVGACVLCGACEASCPEDIVRINDRKPEVKGECPEGCNACYVACPRTYVPDSIISHESAAEPLGEYTEIVSARAPMFRGQDGGVVTALLTYALREGIVDGALVVDRDPSIPWKPVPVLAEDPEDVLRAAGTKYSVCPILKVLKE